MLTSPVGNNVYPAPHATHEEHISYCNTGGTVMRQTQNGQWEIKSHVKGLTYPIRYDYHLPSTWSMNIIINILRYKYVSHVLLVEQVT